MPRTLLHHVANRRTPVRIERDTGEAVNAAHEHQERWQPYCEERANVRQMAARETQYANITYALATHMVTLMRNDKTTAITPNMRVIVTDTNRTLYVYGVNDVRDVPIRERRVELFCGETVQT